MSRRLAIVALALIACASGRARADGKRKIAVLEYRAASRGAPEIGARIAAELARASVYEVIEPAEGRRRIGPGLDAEVARCAGEARCTGTLAQRIGADEALLVGVSQLGDIVLAMQRIEVARGQAVARLAESVPADREPDDAALSDWLHQLFPADAFRRYGELRVVSDVDGALVSINGARKGTTPLGDPLRLAAPGSYRLRVEKVGFVPFQARIDVPPDASMEVRAALTRESVHSPWYKRWYVWAVVGGAAAATGAGLAIYYGTRVDPTPHGFLLPPR